MDKLKEFTTEQLVKEVEGRGKELSIQRILYDQLTQLRSLSKKDNVKNEPELVVKITLAMGEIAKMYLL